MPQFRIPKKEVDLAIVLNTPEATDADLSTGLLTLLDEAGSPALKVAIADMIGFKKDSYAAGTAHVVDVDLTAAVLTANTIYSLKIQVPNLVQPEYDAVEAVRDYIVSTDASPTVAEIQTALINAINADTLNSGVSAASAAGDIVRITASSALMGQLAVSTIIEGATIADQTAYVEPVGTAAEVDEFLYPTSPISTTGFTYDRYLLKYRVAKRHNAISGLKAFHEDEAYVFVDATTGAAYEAVLDAILGGTAIAADYLGVPAI